MTSRIALLLLPLLLTGCGSQLALLSQWRDRVELNELRMEIADLKETVECYQMELQTLEERVSEERARSERDHKTFASSSNKEERFLQVDRRIAKLEELLTRSTTEWSQKMKMVETEVAHFADLRSTLQQISSAMHPVHQSKSVSYLVRPGDTLQKIADEHGTSPEKLRKINSLSSDKILVGQELLLPSK